MVKKNYQLQLSVADKKKTASAMAKNSDMSLKYATEIIREIRGKPLVFAEKFLQDIIEHKRHLPLLQYKKKVAHRKGQAMSGVKAGRYPEKTCKAVLSILESVKANADYKGLDEEKLLVVHGFASQGFARISHQSQGHIGGKRRKRPSVHFEIIVREAA
jgi:large subunit ribosomal protein L22